MEIKKYLTNKDIEISNDDFNIDKLINDLRKGYELSSEVDDKVKQAVAEVNKTSQSQLSDLQAKYDDIEKRNGALNDQIKKVSLERTMVEYGFNKDQFDEVSKMRSSLFGDEADDDKAISQIKDKFKDTYFPTKEEAIKVDVPEEPALNGGNAKAEEISVTRKTGIKDLFLKK